MKVLLTIQHPADVHFFRNVISRLENDGHTVRVLVREKDVNLALLDSYDIDHRLSAGPATGLFELAHVQARYELDIFQEVRRFEPDVLGGVSEPSVGHVGTLTGTPAVIFSDTEHATLQNRLAYPFADRIVTPTCYQGELGAKQIRYPGYKELAYLHPEQFTPKPNRVASILDTSDRPLIVVRLVSGQAAHDIGTTGIEQPVKLICTLEAAGAIVRVSVEGPVPSELRPYEVDIAPSDIHHVLAGADLFLGESATMAAESAVLGTPAIYVSSLRLGYLDELESAFGMVWNMTDAYCEERTVETASSLLAKDPDTWAIRRRTLLESKSNPVTFLRDQLCEVGSVSPGVP